MAIIGATRDRCFRVSAAALRPARAGPAGHRRSMARGAAACMGPRWDRAPREATRTRLSMAATLARLLRNAGTFETWCGKRASCSYRYRVTCLADQQGSGRGPHNPVRRHGIGVKLGEAERDLALRTIELGLCLKHIEGCVQRRRARRIPGALVVLLAQPALKALAAQRPGFPVSIDEKVGKAGAVACVKEPGGRCDIEEDVRAAHGARPSSARPMANSLVPSRAEAIDGAF